MLKRPHIRRTIAAVLVMLGATLIFLAPETWQGIVLLGLGVAVEIAGIAVKHRG